MTNKFCPLNEVPDEQVHMNLHHGSWPIATVGAYTGELVVTNYRWCSCSSTGKPFVQGKEVLIFHWEV